MRRRLTWLGHLFRLNEKTPARITLDEYLKESRNQQDAQNLRGAN